MKRNLLFICLVLTFILTGCKNNETKESSDLSNIDDFIGNLIANLPEDKIDIEDLETDDNYLIVENENEILNNRNENIDKENLEKKLPELKGFTFGSITNADEEIELSDSVKYLEHEWIPMYIYSEVDINSKIASLYLITAYNYSDDKPKGSYNENFKNLLINTFNFFGDYVFSENEHISNIEQLKDDNRLTYIFDTEDFYLITLLQDNIENSRVDITYYFLSKENPHTFGGEESAILKYLKESLPEYRMNIYYKTKEGNFVIEHGEEKEKSNEKSLFDKKFRLR